MPSCHEKVVWFWLITAKNAWYHSTEKDDKIDKIKKLAKTRGWDYIFATFIVSNNILNVVFVGPRLLISPITLYFSAPSSLSPLSLLRHFRGEKNRTMAKDISLDSLFLFAIAAPLLFD